MPNSRYAYQRPLWINHFRQLRRMERRGQPGIRAVIKSAQRAAAQVCAGGQA